MQVGSQLRFEPDDELALSFMANQFPSEYITDEDRAEYRKAKLPTHAEKMAEDTRAKKDLSDYAQLVAD